MLMSPRHTTAPLLIFLRTFEMLDARRDTRADTGLRALFEFTLDAAVAGAFVYYVIMITEHAAPVRHTPRAAQDFAGYGFSAYAIRCLLPCRCSPYVTTMPPRLLEDVAHLRFLSCWLPLVPHAMACFFADMFAIFYVIRYALLRFVAADAFSERADTILPRQCRNLLRAAV